MSHRVTILTAAVLVFLNACSSDTDDAPFDQNGGPGGRATGQGGAIRGLGGAPAQGGTSGGQSGTSGNGVIAGGGASGNGVGKAGSSSGGGRAGAAGSVSNSSCPVKLQRVIPFTPPATGTSLVQIVLQATDCNGNPVAGLDMGRVQAVELVGTSANILSPTETKSDFYEKGNAYGVLVNLAIDFSASIYDSPDATLTTSLREAVVALGQGLLPQQLPAGAQPQTVMYAAVFDGLRTLASLTSNTASSRVFYDSTALESAIANQLKCPDPATPSPRLCVDGSTNLYGATTQIIKDTSTLQFSDIGYTPDYFSKVVVIFTDGRDEANYNTISEVRTTLTQNPGVTVYAVGLRGELDEQALTTIGRNGVFWSNSVAGLQLAFQGVTKKISELAKSFYFFRYCTAKRAGTIRLVLGSKEEMAKIAPSYAPNGNVISETFSAANVAASCILKSSGVSGAAGTAGSAGASTGAPGTAGSAGRI
ncbi:MAG TPA: hypothetical protein VIV60_21100 [Polyangiaceae bacterium]